MSSGVDGDWVQQERDHEYRMASLKEDVNRRRREHFTERLIAVTWGVGIVAVVGIIAALVFLWQQDAGKRGQKVELACVESGGTWTSLSGGSDVCVRVSAR
jgi:hypothetical protein